MKSRRSKGYIATLLCVGMTIPSSALAAPTVAASPRAGQVLPDVALHQGGMLTGQIVDSQGTAVAGAPVTVQTAGKKPISVRTDLNGRFQVAGLTGGVHQVHSLDRQSVCRLWAPHTAPPAAQQGLMLVSSGDVVRGQCDCGTPVCGSAVGGGGAGGIGNWIANHPLITAGAIATAIAVPLALDDDDDAPASP